jgi:hypothetical protein
MARSPLDLDAAMAVYLGAGTGGGYEPLRKEERLEAALGPGWRDVRATLDTYLATMMTWNTDWAREALFQATAVLGRAAPPISRHHPVMASHGP